ncbi:hypothetical protein SDC9_165346 [bioreactor metagenome]|uniref:Uncharacterized protein n=1 Tax=bioreactor metagenome TaxID=1076179 RepID=A0A645FU40_9ZZZZ
MNGEIIDNFIKSDLSKLLLPENIIEIPNKYKYKWTLSGFKYAQFWTSFKDTNKEKTYDENYLCIEPSLEKQGFLESEEINNLAACGFLEFVQSIEVLEK